MPQGLSIIEGNMAARSEADVGAGITWGCHDENGNSTLYRGFPPRQCYDGLHANIVFPPCWDGKTLFSADQSHVAGAVDLLGTCPETHPVSLPTVFIEVTWSTAGFNDMWDQAMNPNQPFVLSQGDPTGYGLHADAMFVWDESALQLALDTCTGDDFGTECAAFNYTMGDICKKAPDVDEDNGLSLLAGLPGGCDLTNGPDEETACRGVTARLNRKKAQIGLFNQTCAATTILTEHSNYAYTSCVAASSPPVTTILPILNMTIQQCLEACDAQNAPFCVASYNAECRMGDQLQATILLAVDEYNCHQPCVGDPNYACGPNYLVYTRGGQPAQPTQNPSNGICGSSSPQFSRFFSFSGNPRKPKTISQNSTSTSSTNSKRSRQRRSPKNHQNRFIRHRKRATH